MDDEESRARGPIAAVPTHALGQPLDALSVSDLDARIALLRAEIVRLEGARDAKDAARAAAGAFFKPR